MTKLATTAATTMDRLTKGLGTGHTVATFPLRHGLPVRCELLTSSRLGSIFSVASGDTCRDAELTFLHVSGGGWFPLSLATTTPATLQEAVILEAGKVIFRDRRLEAKLAAIADDWMAEVATEL